MRWTGSARPCPDAGALRRCMGPPLRESFAWLLDTRRPRRDRAGDRVYRERYGDVGWRENVVYAGIPEVLAGLAQAGRGSVCTSKPELYARRIVQLFGLSEHVHGIYGADLAGTLDDKVKLFAHIAAREGFDAGARHPDRRPGARRARRAHERRARGRRAVGIRLA